MSREEFGHYLCRMMKQKGLKAPDVARNSGGLIDSNYVNKLSRGVGQSPSVKVVEAVSKGLGINPHDVLTAITGCHPDDSQASTAQGLELLALMEKILLDLELLEALRGIVQMPKEGRAVLLEVLRFPDGRNQNTKRRKRDAKKKR